MLPMLFPFTSLRLLRISVYARKIRAFYNAYRTNPGALLAIGAYRVVYHRKIVYYFNCARGAHLLALPAGNAAVCAFLAGDGAFFGV